MRVRHFRAILVGLAFVALMTAQMLAQAVNTAQIHGAITDPTGAAIQGAKIKVTQTNTGMVRTTVSGSEGTFSLCTFMYIDALARGGRLDDACLTFDKMLTYANHLGLFSEEIGATGEQLGNFPQAFTHLALIDSAITLDEKLDRAVSAGTVSLFLPTAP